VNRIETIQAREVFDSRGKPTVEVEIACRSAQAGRAIVPSGASTGRFEAAELRDGDPDRLDGTGVRQAVENVRGEIAAALIGSDASDQREIDRRLCDLDGTKNKSRLGANAILGVSLATAAAAAAAQQIPLVEHFHTLWRDVNGDAGSGASSSSGLGHSLLLPMPMVNMISGGLHAGGNLDVQDTLILPVGASSFRQAMDWIVSVYRRLGELLRQSGYEGYLVGDEGGYGPRLHSNAEAIECVLSAIEAAGLRPGLDVSVGLDVAASHFFEGQRYRLKADGDTSRTADQMIDLIAEWIDQYPIVSVEDGLAEDDWDGWQRLTERIGGRVQLIGDDLFVTNVDRLRRGIESGVGNSVLVKLNQIGTLSETLETLRLAGEHGYRPVISARSGETEDTTIADLAVATGAGQIKIGSVVRSERLAKYNQLLRLEEQLGERAGYLGGKVLAHSAAKPS